MVHHDDYIISLHFAYHTNENEYYDYNIFTTNFKWQIVIGYYCEKKKSNLSYGFKLESMTT